MSYLKVLFAVFATMIISGCALNLTNNFDEPLTEISLQGDGNDKIALINVNGVISDRPQESFLVNKPSVLQDFVAKLNAIKTDSNIKALIIKIDSPGGGVTASDIMYNELVKFKKETGIKIVVSMMNVAASGGYYIALPADKIFAHPTTITGSVGVIFMRPGLSGLLRKVGVSVDVTKSGRNKDMGSIFRPQNKEEEELFNNLIKKLAKRFHSLVNKHRKITPKNLEIVKTARVVIAEDALNLGLIDEIGYLDDVIADTKKIANLENNAQVIVFRKTEYYDDNIYNNIDSKSKKNLSLINTGLIDSISSLKTGFYYLWNNGSN